MGYLILDFVTFDLNIRSDTGEQTGPTSAGNHRGDCH